MDMSLLKPENFLPYNNENFYELAWKERAKIFDGIIPQHNNISDVLEAFTRFELTHTLFPVILHADGDPTSILSGLFNIQPVDLPNADTIIANHISGETRRLEVIASLIDDDTQAVIELGCGYGLNLFRLSDMLGDRDIK